MVYSSENEKKFVTKKTGFHSNQTYISHIIVYCSSIKVWFEVLWAAKSW